MDKKTIEIAYGQLSNNKFIAALGVKDENNEISASLGPDALERAIDLAIEQGYEHFDIKIFANQQQFNDWVTRVLSAA